jgi:radical SAM superfamily enzyme YgiQ (UPF0313 family)
MAARGTNAPSAKWYGTAEKFLARSEDEVLESIRLTGQRYGSELRRVFLADGDALVLPTRRLVTILEAIKTHMPTVRRVSSYCLPRNLRKKSQSEIDELAAAGLKMVYVGAESGDDQVLAAVDKGKPMKPPVRRSTSWARPALPVRS